MATGGAWQSETWDKSAGAAGQLEDTRAAAGAPGQGIPPAMYNVPQPGKRRGTIIVTLVLRVLTFLFALVGFGVLVSSSGQVGITDNNNGNQYIDTIHLGVLSGLKYLFAAYVIAVLYSVVMMIIDLVACLCARALADNKILLWITFLCDQAVAYIMISAGAAAANAVMMTQTDQNVTGIQGTLSCSDLGVDGFCNKAAASTGLGFVVFLFVAITALISSRRAFRL